MHGNEGWNLDALDAVELINLLKQSTWIGNIIQPLPVLKDKHGNFIQDYKLSDWFNKLNEELDDVKQAATAFNLYDTTATSMLHWLDFDELKRIELCKQVNDKNKNRGYFNKV